MPYELGLDAGCLAYGNKKQRSKIILILERDRLHYHAILSDISGQDISSHNDDPKVAMKATRNWFFRNGFTTLPGTDKIWRIYNQFQVYLTTKLADDFSDQEIDEMDIGDFIHFTKDWLSRNQ
jgi:hypothetical protein